MSETQKFYQDKEPAYFGRARLDLIDHIPASPMRRRVLEVGAGDGATLATLKARGLASEVVGIELTDSLSPDLTGQIDRFLVADVETQTLDFPDGHFDILIFGDVLEHLRDPWAALARLAPLLAPGGSCIVSIPNIRYWRALSKILRGDFQYASSGVLDRTHLRFFCRKNMIDLLEAAGFSIDAVEPTFVRQPELRRDRRLNSLTFGWAEFIFAQQYILRGTKRPTN